ncbi:MAG: hypothetical protein ABR973_12960 [Candidatus Acidiferrales bacterium]|jgi:hypothetical protein
MKRDSSGRYFILAEPASAILIFDAAGRRIDQFPNANSHGASIRYAVAIDLDSRGRLFVADRGDNAVKIFAPDGSFVAAIHVTAPTSVVALSDGQFAVTTLQSKRLVQIMDERGATVRTFGDPADEPGAEPSTQSLAQPSAQPVIDRGRITGDSAGNIYFAFTSLPDPTLQRFDRFGYSAYDSVMPAETFGPLAGRTGREIDLGYAMSGLSMPTTVSAWTDLHSLKALSVGERAPRGRGAGAASSAASSSSSVPPTSLGDATVDGNVLSYTTADGGSGDLDVDSSLFGANGIGGLGSGYGQGFMMPGMFGMGFGDSFRGGFMRGGFGGGEGGARPDFAGRFPDGGDHFEHGRPGFGMYRASADLRISLDNPSRGGQEKPVITAVGVDPETKDVWTAVGDTLVHLDSSGNRLDMYYLAITDGASLKPASILVEPDRILIASDPWGVYEFPRPDKPSQSPAPQNTIVPQQLPPAPPPPASR